MISLFSILFFLSCIRFDKVHIKYTNFKLLSKRYIFSRRCSFFDSVDISNIYKSMCAKSLS
jgi:hypothetical protein